MFTVAVRASLFRGSRIRGLAFRRLAFGVRWSAQPLNAERQTPNAFMPIAPFATFLPSPVSSP
jgi:hypothetical protein